MTRNVIQLPHLDLLDQAKKEPDFEKKRDLMKQAVRMSSEGCMYIPLFASPNCDVIQPWFHRPLQDISNMVYFPHEWWLAEH